MQVKKAWQATDQLASPFGRMLLELPAGWTTPARERSIITALLLFAPVIEAMQAQNGVEKGRFALDVRLFKDIYKACTPALRPRLLTSPPAKYLPPEDFRRMFLATYRQRKLSTDDKARLAGTLEAFLSRHPRMAPRYEDVILGLLRSNPLPLSLRGLSMAGAFLTRLTPDDLARLRNKLTSKNASLRNTALRALRQLRDRSGDVAPAVTAFCTSRPLQRKIQDLADRDPDSFNRAEATNLLRRMTRSSKAPSVRPSGARRSASATKR